METLTDQTVMGLTLGVASNVLYAVGKHGKIPAKQAFLWLTRREKNRDTAARDLEAFGRDADELATTYGNTFGIGWTDPDYGNLVDAKSEVWSRTLAAHLLAYPDALDDFRAFGKDGMDTDMTFTGTTVSGDMAVVNGSGSIGNANNAANITITNNHW
ncbi:hypothetical protein [Streptomyces sp. NPDC058861]|uniref:hypothetical protein n=1 Tax=Streptomyces sp. NPDC058861 TaxID=3346653 RepID=UPI00369466B5